MTKQVRTPPTGRDFEAYELVKVQENSTRYVAGVLGISQTRVCQIVENVGQYILQKTPACLSVDDVGRLCNMAKQLAAAQVQFLYGTAVRDYEASKGQPTIRVIETQGRPTTTITTKRPGLGEIKLLDRAVKFAMLGAKLQTSTLASLFTSEDEAAEEDEIIVAEAVENPAEAPCSDCSAAAAEQDVEEYEDDDDDDASDDDDEASDYLTPAEEEEFRRTVLAHEAVQRERERQLLGLRPAPNPAVQTGTSGRVLPR